MKMKRKPNYKLSKDKFFLIWHTSLILVGFGLLTGISIRRKDYLFTIALILLLVPVLNVQYFLRKEMKELELD